MIGDCSFMQPGDVVQLCHGDMWTLSCWHLPRSWRTTLVQTLSTWTSRCRHWISQEHHRMWRFVFTNRMSYFIYTVLCPYTKWPPKFSKNLSVLSEILDIITVHQVKKDHISMTFWSNCLQPWCVLSRLPEALQFTNLCTDVSEIPVFWAICRIVSWVSSAFSWLIISSSTESRF